LKGRTSPPNLSATCAGAESREGENPEEPPRKKGTKDDSCGPSAGRTRKGRATAEKGEKKRQGGKKEKERRRRWLRIQGEAATQKEDAQLQGRKALADRGTPPLAVERRALASRRTLGITFGEGRKAERGEFANLLLEAD